MRSKTLIYAFAIGIAGQVFQASNFCVCIWFGEAGLGWQVILLGFVVIG
jgi:hypothetical protein